MWCPVIVLIAVFWYHAPPTFAAAKKDKLIGSFNTPGSASDVIVLNTFAYVADGSNGVLVFDVSNPTVPVLYANYDTSGTARKLASSGSYLYVADATSLVVLNITNPIAPSFTTSLSLPSTDVKDVSIDGSRAYVLGTTSTSNALFVVDISSPSSPTLLTTYTTGAASDVQVAGGYVYLIGGTIFEVVSRYPELRQVGLLSSSKSFMDSAQIVGSYAYVNDFLLGLDVIDVSQPSQPTMITPTTYFQSGGYGGGTAVANGYVFLTGFSGDVFIYDVAQAGKPILVDQYDVPANGNALVISNTLAFVASAAAGLHILDVSKPDAVPPTLTPIGPETITIPPGSTYTDPGAKAHDDVDGDISDTTTITTNLNPNVVGIYFYTITVTDRAGNSTSITRTIIVAAKVKNLKTTKGSVTITIARKKKIIKPFGSRFRGPLFAQQAIVKKLSEPIYLFVPLGSHPNPLLVVMNFKGKIIDKKRLRSFSTNGLTANSIADKISVYLALAPRGQGKTVRLYKMNAAGAQGLSSVTVSRSSGKVIVKFLKLYRDQYGLASMIKGKIKTLKVWKYSVKAKKFTHDRSYKVKNIVVKGTTLTVRRGAKLP